MLADIRVSFVAAIAVVICLLSTSCGGDSEEKGLDKELSTLDEMVRMASKFDQRKQNSIDSVKRVLKSAGNVPSLRRWQLFQNLGDEFKSFSSDSAVVYYDRAKSEAIRLGNDSLLTLSRIDRVNALSAAGIFSAATAEMHEIDTVGMSKQLKIEYALAGRQLYSYMTSYIQGHERLYPEVEKSLNAFTDYLIENMSPEDPMCQLYGFENSVKSGHYSEVKPQLEALLKKLPKESNLYARAAFQLALVNGNAGNETEYARYMALAAQSDLKGSVKEGMALPMLAEWLYNHGDTKRAYSYINLSMKDASIGNARMRTGMIANAITVIDDAYKRQMEKSRMLVTIFLILAVVLLIVSGELMHLVLKRKRKMEEAQQKLSRLTRLQDTYIGHFIALCANYSDKLGSMSKLVDRKISSGQADELMKMIRSGKFADEHSEDFFEHFDKAFLDLYPDFVDDMNSLLRPECRITLRNESILTPELRIYAFVRLGVEESVKISKILRYSPATIYTYRNKMRNRAINRETFEEDVMKIGQPG